MGWLDWPTTSLDVTRWLLVCGGLYIATRLLIGAFRRRPVPREWSLAGDALMFGTSFLLFSGFVGLQGATRALFHT
jgi:hypothetical protein